MVGNLYNERCEANLLLVKVESVNSHEDWLIAAEKAMAYADNILDSAVKAKEITEGALAKVKRTRRLKRAWCI